MFILNVNFFKIFNIFLFTSFLSVNAIKFLFATELISIVNIYNLDLITFIIISLIIFNFSFKYKDKLEKIPNDLLACCLPPLITLLTFPAIVSLFNLRDIYSVFLYDLTQENIAYLCIVLFCILSLKVYKNRNLTKTDYVKNNNVGYTLFLSFVVSFIIIKILILSAFNGSYIDEYTHITSAISLLENGELPKFTNDFDYTRGIGISVLIYFLYLELPQTLAVAKIAPLILGVFSAIFLYIISKHAFSTKYVIFSLIIYSISLATILNHFYVRFYSLYEMFLTLSCILFLYKSFFIFNKYVNLFLFISFNTAILLLSNDNGIYMLIFFNAISAILFLLKYWQNETFNLIRYIVSNKFRLYMTFTLILAIFSVLLFKLGFIDKFEALFAYKNTSVFPSNLLGYKQLFFIDTPILGTLLFLPLINIFLKVLKFKRKIFTNLSDIELLYISFIFIFSFHLLSSKDIQLFRGIFYLVPLIYLFSFYGMSMSIKEKLLSIFTTVLIALSLLNQYPTDFFTTPTIPQESVYIGGDLYKLITEKCVGNLVISTQYPYVLKFHNINVDYYLQEKITDDIKSKSLVSDKNTIYTSITNTPTITSLDELKAINESNMAICLIERSPVTRHWLSAETITYIQANFHLESSDINQNLYIKNIISPI